MSKIKLIRISLLVVLLYLAISSIAHELPNLQKAKDLVGSINYFWLFIAVLFQTGQYIGDGILSQKLLSAISFKINFKDTFRIAAMNVFAAHLLPVGQAGAFATSYYFYHRIGIPAEAIVFLSLAWGVITNILIFIIMIASLFFIRDFSFTLDSQNHLLLFLIAISISITGIYLIRKPMQKFLVKIMKKRKLDKKASEYLSSFSTYKHTLFSHKKDVSFGITGALIYLLSNIATLAFSFFAFGSSVSFALLCFAYTASLLLGIVTFAPAGIGATEATLILIFSQAHIDPAVSLAAILLFRLITFWIPIPVGAFAYASLKRSTKVQLKHNATNQNS